MNPPAENRCGRCGDVLLSGEAKCPRCLLEAVVVPGAESLEEQLFEQLLALPPSARTAFLEEVDRSNPAAAAGLRLLWRGFQESESDSSTVFPPIASSPEPGLPESEQAGAQVGNFRLVRLVGEGGMGTVWEAEQLWPVRRTVALKLVKLGMDTREVVKRFERERQTLALLAHPNIAQVFEAGATNLGRPYFVMELVRGRPLTTWCDQEDLDLSQRLALFLEVCAAVEHAHQKGVIHRDLKPSNILVAEGRAKVIDFGVAKATQGAGDTLFTRQAQVLGTPAYMSPEQAQTDGLDVDTRTDVYSLGVVLYELLTGLLPIDSKRLAESSLAEMQRLLIEVDPVIPSLRLSASGRGDRSGPVGLRHADQLRGDLDWVVMKAIRKDRNDRYSSVAALADDLRRHLAGEPVSAVPPTLAYQAGKFVRRHRTAVAAAVLVAVTMIVATAVSLRQAVRANRAHEQTKQTVADMYARSGLAAGGGGDATRASLWFANSAIIARDDPARREANRVRAAAWRRTAPTPVRALLTGFTYCGRMLWHPDGRALIVRADGEPRTLVWDLEQDRLWRPAFSNNLERAVWDPTGGRLAVITAGEAVVLEYPSGRPLARTAASGVASLAFSPDGRQLAVGGIHPFLWNWEANARENMALQDAVPSNLQFSADGRWLLLRWAGMTGVCSVDKPGVFSHSPRPTADPDESEFIDQDAHYLTTATNGVIEVRGVEDGRLVEDLGAKPLGSVATEAPAMFASSLDGRFIVRGRHPMMDRANRRPATFPSHKNVIASYAFSPDGAWMASAGYDDVVKLWSLPSGDFIGTVGFHHSAVLQLAFSPDSTLLASSQDGFVRVWRVATPPASRQISFASPSLVALSKDGASLLASGLNRYLSTLATTRAVALATGQPLGPEITPGGLIMDAAWSPDGTWVAIAVSTTPNRAKADLQQVSGTGNLQFWDPRSGRRLGEPVPLPGEPRGLAIHPSGQVVGVCCNSGYGLEIDVRTRELRQLFHHRQNHDADATLNNGRCAYSPDGRVFAVWGLFQFFHLWDRAAGRELVEPHQRGVNIFDLDFSDGVVSAMRTAQTSGLEFLDLRTGGPAAPLIAQSGWPFLGRFNQDGSLFLTTSRDRVGRVWDWRNGTLVCPVLPHDDEVMAGTFIPGRPWVVTGGHDGAIKVWDHRTGMLMCPPVLASGLVLDLKATPDGRRLVASGMLDGPVLVIDLPALLPAPELDLESARVLAEIDSTAQVHPGGDVVPLGATEWLARWTSFRQARPGFSGHRLRLSPAEMNAWHTARARELASDNPSAAEWHRRALPVPSAAGSQ